MTKKIECASALAFMLLAVTPCRSQQQLIGQFLMIYQQYPNLPSISLEGPFGNTASGIALSPGSAETITVAITSGPATFQPTSGTVGTGIEIFQWPQYPNSYEEGPYDTNVNLSNFTYIDSTHVRFTIAATGGTANETDQLRFLVNGYTWLFPVTIQPVPPPPPPSPAPAQGCGIPTIDSVVPSTWIAGQTYPITINGTGFVTPAVTAANPNCPGNPLTISVPTGSVTVSDVTVVDSTKITATVAPANTDPDETATITLWGGGNEVSDVARAHGNPAAMISSGVRPEDGAGTPPPGMSGPAAQTTAQVKNVQLFVLDPYLTASYVPPQNGLTTFDQTSLVDNLLGYSSEPDELTGPQAYGIIADGTATAILIVRCGINAPVTFSGSKGLRFSAWNASFLNSAPDEGENPLPSVQPVQIGNNYYAFALVTAPEPNGVNISSYGLRTMSIQATVATSGGPHPSDPVLLDLEPAPVIFVHGLWGDTSSLTPTSNYLGKMAPWSTGNPLYNPLNTFCYAKDLPFDAMSVPPGDNSDDPCEITSQDRLGLVISQIQKNLNVAHYIGGRVDLVVHSMGGLVARHYSGLSLYKTTRDLMQGTFHTIVTIDTPENGDALAPFLLSPAVAGATCSSTKVCVPQPPPPAPLLLTPLLNEARNVWELKCAPNDTLATCLGTKIQNPLGPPGSGPGGFNISLCPSAGSNSCGAVASLAPNGKNFEPSALPGPRIPNSHWFALGSDWEDRPTSPSSMLRSFLNNLLSALSLPESQTLTSVLKDSNNDVIVTTSSQFWNTSGTPAIPTVEFQYLAHSQVPLGPNFVNKLGEIVTGTLNAGVTNDSRVSACVGLILLNLSTAGCVGQVGTTPTTAVLKSSDIVWQDQTAAQLQTETPEETAERLTHPLNHVPERMSVKAPEGDALLGNPLQVEVTLAPGKLVGTIDVGESNRFGDYDQGGGSAAVVSEHGSTKTIEVIPVQTGPLDIEISVLYSDNGLASKTIHLNVVPSSRHLQKFSLDGGPAMGLRLSGEINMRQDWLRPVATYDGQEYPFLLKTCYGIALSVGQDESDPVIRVSKEGLVTAIRPGKATIIGDFDGVKDQVQVTVEP